MNGSAPAALIGFWNDAVCAVRSGAPDPPAAHPLSARAVTSATTAPIRRARRPRPLRPIASILFGRPGDHRAQLLDRKLRFPILGEQAVRLLHGVRQLGVAEAGEHLALTHGRQQAAEALAE